MIYRIKEKFWSLGDKFFISDYDEQPVFEVQGKAFSWGDKLSFRDTDGREIAFINQKMWSLKPTYEIYIDGELFARVVKEVSWFKKKFTLDVPGPNDYEIEGSFWDHEFTFRRMDEPVAYISKARWSWTDSYGIDIVPGEDDISILCTCIVIDQILGKDK